MVGYDRYSNWIFWVFPLRSFATVDCIRIQHRMHGAAICRTGLWICFSSNQPIVPWTSHERHCVLPLQAHGFGLDFLVPGSAIEP